MASGSFARGRDSINANASMVFVGNISQPVDTLVKTSHLLAPFPEAMIDPAEKVSEKLLQVSLDSVRGLAAARGNGKTRTSP